MWWYNLYTIYTGLFAGVSMIFIRSTSLSLYAAAKALEVEDISMIDIYYTDDSHQRVELEQARIRLDTGEYNNSPLK